LGSLKKLFFGFQLAIFKRMQFRYFSRKLMIMNTLIEIENMKLKIVKVMLKTIWPFRFTFLIF